MRRRRNFGDVNRKISLFIFSCSSSPINFLLIFLQLIPKLLVFFLLFFEFLETLWMEICSRAMMKQVSFCALWMGRFFFQLEGCWFLVLCFSLPLNCYEKFLTQFLMRKNFKNSRCDHPCTCGNSPKTDDDRWRKAPAREWQNSERVEANIQIPNTYRWRIHVRTWNERIHQAMSPFYIAYFMLVGRIFFHCSSIALSYQLPTISLNLRPSACKYLNVLFMFSYFRIDDAPVWFHQRDRK